MKCIESSFVKIYNQNHYQMDFDTNFINVDNEIVNMCRQHELKRTNKELKIAPGSFFPQSLQLLMVWEIY